MSACGRRGRGKKADLENMPVAEPECASGGAPVAGPTPRVQPARSYEGLTEVSKKEQTGGGKEEGDEHPKVNGGPLPAGASTTYPPSSSSALLALPSYSPCVEAEHVGPPSAPPGSSPSVGGEMSHAGPGFSGTTKLMGLGKNQLKMLRTPQFERRLRLFIEHLKSVGCCTIPVVSKFLAKAEGSVNGPDR